VRWGLDWQGNGAANSGTYWGLDWQGNGVANSGTYWGPTDRPVQSAQTFESNFNVKRLFESNKLQNASNEVQNALKKHRQQKRLSLVVVVVVVVVVIIIIIIIVVFRSYGAPKQSKLLNDRLTLTGLTMTCATAGQ
jgi:hypothetical protein